MEYIYAIDGDDIGEKIEKALFNDDLEGATYISSVIESTLKILNHKFINLGGETIFLAGDSLLIRSKILLDIPDTMLKCDDMTFSMGVANSPSNAVLALKKAKGLGKNRIITFLGKENYEG